MPREAGPPSRPKPPPSLFRRVDARTSLPSSARRALAPFTRPQNGAFKCMHACMHARTHATECYILPCFQCSLVFCPPLSSLALPPAVFSIAAGAVGGEHNDSVVGVRVDLHSSQGVCAAPDLGASRDHVRAARSVVTHSRFRPQLRAGTLGRRKGKKCESFPLVLLSVASSLGEGGATMLSIARPARLRSCVLVCNRVFDVRS